MKVLVASLLLVSLVLSSCFVEEAVATAAAASPPSPMPPPGFCESKCAVRCSKAGRQDRCLKYCGICCRECSCVPSGTYGNKSECPCYANLKNSKDQPKCP
ncbi:Gibberellin regulated protein [Corchorus olitorius]|uniref:Gibberellin regulated protein n=1 Tax=Corchorus olitorius TaxID=93759 RepID=A0A1R3K463_9ROSI|nr:Gibberellin regulated protein [Corchorus olitorius]